MIDFLFMAQRSSVESTIAANCACSVRATLHIAHRSQKSRSETAHSIGVLTVEEGGQEGWQQGQGGATTRLKSSTPRDGRFRLFSLLLHEQELTGEQTRFGWARLVDHRSVRM
jgi:hypothetical protein